MPINLDEIKRVIELAARSGVASVEVTHEGLRVRVENAPGRAPAMPAPVVPAHAAPLPRVAPASAPTDGATAVRAPTDGVIYYRPSPDADPFTTEGAQIEAGQTLCLIEVMKMLYPVTAPQAGRVRRILAQDGKQVEFDEVLLELE
ncbi:MAG: acetyl-CoA carboxylase biotin carboxyl carrier protein subunit [Paracoccus sp. (in: a-proteobacteria)]|uniref:acetyl-CoA carboxylase biotin carboxyl carrier protein n=1 Tax=Paracoccus sp. TaxID=267 RepID=UPI0039E2CA74